MSKTCGECRYFEYPAGQCAKVMEYNFCHGSDNACEYFEPKVITKRKKGGGMKIENEKIIQATEDELYSYWLSRGWDDVYSFPEYMQRMKDAGCEVIAEIPPPTVFQQIAASPEVLAEKFVYCLNSSSFRVIDSAGRLLAYENEVWGSTILPGSFWTEYEEAIAATVARLKEVAE